jgi:hypothetical protein
MRKHFILLSLACLAAAGPAAADTVFLTTGKAAKVAGTVAEESAQGIKLKSRAELIPAETIRDVEYTLPSTLKIGISLPATNAEAAAVAAPEAKRAKLLDEAITKYREALTNLDPAKAAEAHQEQLRKLDAALAERVRRHFQYKVAYLFDQKARLEGTAAARAAAAAQLKEFKAAHPDCWQLPAALEALARLQVELKAYDEAEQTLKALADAPVSQTTRLEAELLSARVSLQAGKPKEAIPRLEALITRHQLAENHPQALRARLAQAECLSATGDLPGAKGRLEKVVDLTQDRDLKAAAYNTLGVCHLRGNQLKDALWAFLWVEVEYNQNKDEHARALYYLVQVFSRLDRPARAEACLQALLGDPLLADTEYQKKAAAEKK